MNTWFQELSEENRSLIDQLRRKGWTKGLRQLAVDKYPDPVHFVYELLQNAEDQNAHNVSFEMTRSGLIFRHDGEPFKREDVINITGIGTSDKLSQTNKIGRFGIGFKSVFVITNRPEVYTVLENEPFSFAIEELFVPVAQANDRDLFKGGQTCFALPFKPEEAKDIYERLHGKFCDLGADTLLFLRAINEINWQTETDEGVYLCERDPVSGIRSLLGEAGPRDSVKSSEETEYLVYSAPLTLEDTDRDLSISIAFRMAEGKIVPEPQETVLNVFFPTTEKTDFRFKLHAPFLLTDNRANVKWSEPINTTLIRAGAALLTASLADLRDRRLLDVLVLESLPIKFKETFVVDATTNRLRKAFVSGVALPFEPFFSGVRAALQSQPLLPADGGRYVSAATAKMARTAAIRNLLDESQLQALYESPSALSWLSSEITEDKTPELRKYLRDVLEVGEIDPDAFAARLTKGFFSAQSDEWMIAFYSFLLDQEALWDAGKVNPVLRKNPLKPIIRLENGSAVAPFQEDGRTPKAFLPPSYATLFPTVKKTLLEQKRAYDFFVKLGLKLPNVVDDLLKTTLPRLRSSEPSSEEAYGTDLQQIADAIQECPDDRRADLRNALSATPFIWCCSAMDSFITSYQKPPEAFLATDAAKTWFEGDPTIWFVQPQVTNTPSWQAILEFLNAERPIVRSDIPLVNQRAPGHDGHVIIYYAHSNNQRGLHGFFPRTEIMGLEHALSAITAAKAKVLWSILLKNADTIYGTVETATRKTFENVLVKKVQFSVMGELCASHAWLPDTDGVFHRPGTMFLSDLPEGFDKSSARAKQVAEALKMQKSDVHEAAEKIGVPSSIMADFSRAFHEDPEGMKQLLAGFRRITLPEHSVPNPERRLEKVTAAALSAPATTYEIRDRSVRVSANDTHSNARAYLTHFYNTSDGHMVCQICSRAMPFQLENGEDYFEAVTCFKRFPTENAQNHLALCPTCAAKYQYANGTDSDSWKEAVLGANRLILSLILAKEKVSVHFTEPHLIDLKEMLQAADQKSEVAKGTLITEQVSSTILSR